LKTIDQTARAAARAGLTPRRLLGLLAVKAD